MYSIFLSCSLGNDSLILRISLATLGEEAKAWAYNFFYFLLFGFLKYLVITLISLGDLAGIGGGRLEIDARLAIFLLFLNMFTLFGGWLNYIFTFCLKEKFLLYAISLFQPAS